MHAEIRMDQQRYTPQQELQEKQKDTNINRNKDKKKIKNDLTDALLSLSAKNEQSVWGGPLVCHTGSTFTAWTYCL